jgi:hypothetical protein
MRFQERFRGRVKPPPGMELEVFRTLGDALAYVLAMMTSTSLPQQSMSIIRGNSSLGAAYQSIARLWQEMEFQSCVRPVVVLGAIFACLAAWGIAAIFVAIG